EVDSDRALVPVRRKEKGTFTIEEGRTGTAAVVAFVGILDLDHIGAEIAQPHRCRRTGQVTTKIDNPDPAQRHLLSFAHPYRPFQCGLRFSRNAETPSLKSSLM